MKTREFSGAGNGVNVARGSYFGGTARGKLDQGELVKIRKK